MEELNWVNAVIDDLASESTCYPDKSVLIYTAHIIEKQAQQIELLKSKLDGIAWSPKDWHA